MNVVAHPAQDNKMMALIRRTVAADCNDDEFNMFAANCSRLGLDPLRRQAYALVYNKDKPAKRRMSIIVGIDGFRAVAARSGNYRPDEEEPRFEYDEALKSSTNPLGIVKATVKIHQYSHGQWFPVTGVAYWDEFAPIKEEWAEGEDGKRRPSGKKTLDGKWPTMSRLMIAKCAEAQALRRAWPDDFSNVYAPEEMDRAKAEADLLPAEAAEQAMIEDRQARIGIKGKTVLTDWLDNKALEPVPVGSFADRVCEFLEAHAGEGSQIILFRERNRFGLREFWSHAPSDALELNKKMESALAKATAEGGEE